MTFTKLHAAVLTALTNNKGAAMAEYALLLALIAVAAIAVLPALGTAISDKFTAITTAL